MKEKHDGRKDVLYKEIHHLVNLLMIDQDINELQNERVARALEMSVILKMREMGDDSGLKKFVNETRFLEQQIQGLQEYREGERTKLPPSRDSCT